MILSDHFTLAEMTATDTGIENIPGPEETENLKRLCTELLEPLRARIGPLRITSGYRCPEVNEAVGGSTSSQHMKGEAADFRPLRYEMTPAFSFLVKDSGLKFGQAIFEPGWIHLSLPRTGKSNQIALVYDGKTYGPYA